jgi:hypothetical protein
MRQIQDALMLPDRDESIEAAARIAHEVNRRYCRFLSVGCIDRGADFPAIAAALLFLVLGSERLGVFLLVGVPRRVECDASLRVRNDSMPRSRC